jgi:hypothetical protein
LSHFVISLLVFSVVISDLTFQTWESHKICNDSWVIVYSIFIFSILLAKWALVNMEYLHHI